MARSSLYVLILLNNLYKSIMEFYKEKVAEEEKSGILENTELQETCLILDVTELRSANL